VLGFLAFVLLFDKEEETINVPFLAVGFFMNRHVFLLLPGLYSVSLQPSMALVLRSVPVLFCQS
jgi:hypothetical protein